MLAIDPAAKSVRVRDLATGDEVDEAYDFLVLSPGASPFRPPIPGIERALALRNIEDVDAMSARLAEVEASAEDKVAVVMGGGFIGLEMAENLTHRGWAVTVVELADQIMAPLDPEMADLVANRLTAHGVRVELGVSVMAIHDGAVELSDGRSLPARSWSHRSASAPTVGWLRPRGWRSPRSRAASSSTSSSARPIRRSSPLGTPSPSATSPGVASGSFRSLARQTARAVSRRT